MAVVSVIHETGNASPSHCFWCPGCEVAHGIDGKWSFNGDLDRPTISPSVLMTGRTWVLDDPTAPVVFEDVPGMQGVRRDARPGRFIESRCHSFVTDGHIQFLTDSTHQLAGQTVDLPAWPIGGDA